MTLHPETLRDSAHYELRQEHERWLLFGLLAALFLHAGLARVSPQFSPRPYQLSTDTSEPFDVVDVPVWVPAAPAAVERPDFPDGIPEPVDQQMANPLIAPAMEDLLRPPAVPNAESGHGNSADFRAPEMASPEVLHWVPAAYPQMARLAEAEGTVLLLVTVGIDGRVLSAEIERSDAIRSLEKAALQAVRGWLFRPAEQGGRPVSVRVRVPFEFRLN